MHPADSIPLTIACESFVHARGSYDVSEFILRRWRVCRHVFIHMQQTEYAHMFAFSYTIKLSAWYRNQEFIPADSSTHYNTKSSPSFYFISWNVLFHQTGSLPVGRRAAIKGRFSSLTSLPTNNQKSWSSEPLSPAFAWWTHLHLHQATHLYYYCSLCEHCHCAVFDFHWQLPTIFIIARFLFRIS